MIYRQGDVLLVRCDPVLRPLPTPLPRSARKKSRHRWSRSRNR